MTLQCYSTPDAITSILLAGDALLNFTQHKLNTTDGTRFITLSPTGAAISEEDEPTEWDSAAVHSLKNLISRDLNRIVVVSEEDSPAVAAVLDVLRMQQIPCCHCVLAPDCDSNDFMDAEDAEAVAERLRQLGYL